MEKTPAQILCITGIEDAGGTNEQTNQGKNRSKPVEMSIESIRLMPYTGPDFLYHSEG